MQSNPIQNQRSPKNKSRELERWPEAETKLEKECDPKRFLQRDEQRQRQIQRQRQSLLSLRTKLQLHF